MSLGTPNLVVGALTFRPTSQPGVYTWDGADPKYRNQLIISSTQSGDKIRMKFERLQDVAPEVASGNVEKTIRVYTVVELPDHTSLTSTVVNAHMGALNTLMTVANVDAVRRGEV